MYEELSRDRQRQTRRDMEAIRVARRLRDSRQKNKEHRSR
jgi:hypothetical protein